MAKQIKEVIEDKSCASGVHRPSDDDIFPLSNKSIKSSPKVFVGLDPMGTCTKSINICNIDKMKPELKLYIYLFHISYTFSHSLTCKDHIRGIL